MISEAIHEICRKERINKEITSATAVTSSVENFEKRSLLASVVYFVFRFMESVIAPVLIRESIVDMIAAEIPTKTKAPKTGGIKSITMAVTTPPAGICENIVMPAMPVARQSDKAGYRQKSS